MKGSVRSFIFVLAFIAATSSIAQGYRSRSGSNYGYRRNTYVRRYPTRRPRPATYRPPTTTTTEKPRNLVTFTNGKSFDRDALLSEFRQPLALYDSTEVTQFFGDADQIIQRNVPEMHFRNFFSQTEGNEYLGTNNLSAVARKDERHLGIIVKRVGINVFDSFNVDGFPTDDGVKELSNLRDVNCPFERADRQACSSKFREPTGRCTNSLEKKKTWGMAMTAYTRVLPAAYEDGIGDRRTTGHSSRLPLKSPREISTTVTTTNVVLNNDGYNAQIMQWGQYIAHEISHIAEAEANVACCPDQIFAAQNGRNVRPTRAQLQQIRQGVGRLRNDVCMQIEHDNDPVYKEYVCMAQTRSKPTPVFGCAIAPRQQMNTATHVMDGSVVYGSSKDELDKLRKFRGGRMRTQKVNNNILPPQNRDNCPSAIRNANRCPFRAGDPRINVTPNLASIHTVPLIKHNQIAVRLSQLNPRWNDEKLFQETRKIMVAIETNIHYYEYLPLVLGPNIIRRYGLNRYTGFNSNVNPSVLSEMAHAAFRFGHSTVNDLFIVKNDDGPGSHRNLTPLFGDSDFVYNGGVNQCLRGLLEDNIWFVDRNYPQAMRNSLFNKRNDIVALNINRGRDHGFNSYVKYRKHYGLSFPRSFNDLSRTHPPDVIAQLRKVYRRVEDVELYIAGVTEKPIAGGLVGELFANIMGDGFSRLRNGDRFFFESRHSGLNSAQIREIKRYKYHQLLCDTTGIASISSNAFIRPGTKVGRKLGVRSVLCRSLTPLNLNLWSEQPLKPQCQWRVTRVSECCNGRKEVTRVCQGAKNCNCPGSSTVVQSCRCYGYHCYTNRFTCAWQRKYTNRYRY